MDDLISSFEISAAGMKAQGTRLRVISENIANADSLPSAEGEAPYRRKVITFRNLLDRDSGVDMVRVKSIEPDQSSFKQRYEPGHPAANADGYVTAPNVNSIVESMDMLEAQRSYKANLGMIRTAREMATSTIDILR